MKLKNNRPTASIAILLLMSLACSSKYMTHSISPPTPLQWPYQPARAKITYLHAIYGFERKGGSSSILRTITGSADKQNDSGFIVPVAVAIGSDGRIAVADTGAKCVHLFIPEKGRYRRISGTERDPISSPVGLTFDESLCLYIADSTGKVLVFDPDTALLFQLEAANKEKFQRPTGVAFNSNQQLLYIVDAVAAKVYAFQKDGKFKFSFGTRGSGQGQFNSPTHISHSAGGTLFITDALNFRIQLFDETGKFLSSFGHHGNGSGDFAMPKGIGVDRDGIIFIADSLFDNVQLFNDQGEFLLTLGKRGLDFGEFWLPSGVFIDSANLLYVCDSYNRRIQVFRISENYIS